MKDLIDALKSKERETISTQVSVEIHRTREWLQEHGEWALLVGILAGVVFVLFFKVLILLIVLGGLASYVIWQISLEDAPAKSAFGADDSSVVETGARPESAVDHPVVELPEDEESSLKSSNGHREGSSTSREQSSD